MKVNGTTLLKILGTALSVGGMIVTGVASTKETNATLEKLVDTKIQPK